MIDQFRRVLFLGAHPDDEMACSGTLARLALEGAEIHAITFSNCEDLIPDGFTVADLIDEWHQAMDLLGVVDLRMEQISNRDFPAHRQDVLSVLDEYRGQYDIVFCPTTFDAHQDHATVSSEAIRAFKTATILGYELPLNEIGKPVTMNGFVGLSKKDMDAKVKHVKTYTSQSKRPYMAEEYIRSLARVRGMQSGYDNAEAFEVIRWRW